MKYVKFIFGEVCRAPTSNNFPMEKRDPDANSLKMCARVALAGSSWMLRVQVCIGCTIALFGNNTWILLSVGCVLITGITLWMYWLIVSSSKK